MLHPARKTTCTIAVRAVVQVGDVCQQRPKISPAEAHVGHSSGSSTSEWENVHRRVADDIVTSSNQPARNEVILKRVSVGNHVKENGSYQQLIEAVKVLGFGIFVRPLRIAWAGALRNSRLGDYRLDALKVGVFRCFQG